MKSGHGKDNIRTNATLVYQYGHFLEKIKVSVAGQTVSSNSAGDSCIQELPHRRQTITNKKITARTEADSRSGTLQQLNLLFAHLYNMDTKAKGIEKTQSIQIGYRATARGLPPARFHAAFFQEISKGAFASAEKEALFLRFGSVYRNNPCSLTGPIFRFPEQ
jgi:hypothetical protein